MILQPMQPTQPTQPKPRARERATLRQAPEPGAPSRRSGRGLDLLLIAAVVGSVGTVGCNGGEETSAGATTTSEGTTTAGTTTEGSTSEGSITSGETETETETETATTGDPGPICGDGVVDPGELCDDGDQEDGNGCNTDCTPSGALRWQRLFSEGSTARGQAVAAVSDGAVIAGLQGSNGWLTQIDRDGATLWDQRYDRPGFVSVIDVAIAPTQEIWAVGSLTPEGERNYWVFKTDATGDILWEDEYASGLGDDYATSVVAVGEDAIVVGVVSTDSESEYMIRRYTGDGTLIWSERYAHNLQAAAPIGPTLALAPDDTLWLGGQARTVDNRNPDLVLTMALTGGPPLWVTISELEDNVIYGLAIAPQGRVYAASAEIFGAGFGVSELALRDGKPLWKTHACTGVSGRGIAVDPRDGKVVAVGDGLSGGGDSNIRLCKFTADGDFLWGQDIDGELSGGDLGYGVTVLDDGTIIAVGRSQSAVSSSDAWAAAFSP